MRARLTQRTVPSQQKKEKKKEKNKEEKEKKEKKEKNDKKTEDGAEGRQTLPKQVRQVASQPLEAGAPAIRRQLASQTPEAGAPAIRGGGDCGGEFEVESSGFRCLRETTYPCS